MATWRDGTTTVRSGSVLEAAVNGYTDQQLSGLNIKAFGAKVDDNTNDTTAVQAAINAAQSQGRPLLVPGGTSRLSAQLTYDCNLPLEIVGEGKQSAIWKWTSDVGAGNYALHGLNSTTGSQTWKRISGMRFEGPALNTTLGTASTAMYGVEWVPRLLVEWCMIRGFKAGLVCNGDHQTVRDTAMSSNYYGIHCLDSPTKGNQVIDNCDLTGQAFASIAMANGGKLNGAQIRDSHLGFSPYGVYGETGTGDMLSSVLFTGTDMEACGNGVIFAEGYTRDVQVLEMERCAASFSTGYKIAARNADYQVAVGLLSDWRIRSGSMLNDPGAAGRVRAEGGISEWYWDCAGPAFVAAATDGIPIVHDPNFGGIVSSEWKANGRHGQWFYNGNGSAAAIVKNDLVVRAAGYNVRSTVLGTPVGAAVLGGPVDQIIPVCISGGPTDIAADAGSTIAAGDRLKPDATHIGKVVTAAAGDPDIIGYARSSVASAKVIGYVRLS